MGDYTPAPAPANEAERLQKVLELGLLDNKGKYPTIDRVTAAASRILKMPMVWASLIDKENWSSLACSGAEHVVSPRGLAFCSYTILHDDVNIVPNLAEAPIYRDFPQVKEGPLRAYAGHPINVNGFNVGTLCLIDLKPREFSEEDKQNLRDLARWAALEYMEASKK